MGLLDLPAELLDGVITLTVPSGIESFALSCKAVYQRAAPQIRRHNALKRKWKDSRNPGVAGGFAFHILYEISRDPLIAQYIEKLNLTTDIKPEERPDFDEFRTEGEAMEKIRQLVTESAHLEKAGVDVDGWWEQMLAEDDPGDEEEEVENAPCAIVSLLGQLPNLKTLQLPSTWSHFRPFEDGDDKDKELASVLDNVVESANSGNAVDKPLGKLEVILPFMAEGYEERAGLQSVQPFLALNSMRELFAVSCIAVDDGYTGIPFAWRSPTLHSPLRRVEFASCCMDAEGISALLSHTPLLEVFKYSHQTKWHGCEHDWNPGAVVEAIARHCGQTLIELAITIDDMFGEIVNGASSFRSFPILQRLEADVRIFCGPPVESGQRGGMNARVPEGERPWTEEDIPCIGSMLPTSIVEVQIDTDFPDPDEQALKMLLKNIREQRLERLRKLDKVIIRQYNGHGARELVDEAGVTLAVFGEEPNARPRSMMPQWKRDFEERVGGLRFT